MARLLRDMMVWPHCRSPAASSIVTCVMLQSLRMSAEPAGMEQLSGTSLSPLSPSPSGRLYADLSINTARELESLSSNTVLGLPRSVAEAIGLRKNFSDRGSAEKTIWIGRAKHLYIHLQTCIARTGLSLDQVRREILETAFHKAENRDHCGALEVARLSELDDKKLQLLIRACTVVQKRYRGRRQRSADNMLCRVLESIFLGHGKSSNDVSYVDPQAPKIVVRGFIVLLAGSTGVAGDALRYMRMLAAMGYVVITPDEMASKTDLRYREEADLIESLEAHVVDYFGQNHLYSSKPEGKLVYNSSTDYLLRSQRSREKLARVHAASLKVRVAGLAFTLRRLPSFVQRRGVFIHAISEGAIALSTFDDKHFSSFIRGKVLCSWPVENNFWALAEPRAAKLHGDPNIPVLNLMGSRDEYFNANDSVAATVASVLNNQKVRGHGFRAMQLGRLRRGVTVLLDGAKHNLLLAYDTIIREILSDFFNDPERICNIDRTWSNVNGPITLHNLIDDSETKEAAHSENGGLVKFFKIRDSRLKMSKDVTKAGPAPALMTAFRLALSDLESRATQGAMESSIDEIIDPTDYDMENNEPDEPYANANEEFVADLRRRISKSSLFDVAFECIHRDGMSLGDHDTEVNEADKEE